MARLANKLRNMRELNPDDNIVIFAQIFHDGSYVVQEYSEDEPDDADILESGIEIDGLDIFLDRKVEK